MMFQQIRMQRQGKVLKKEHLFIFFNQEIFIELVIYEKLSLRPQGYGSEQNTQKLLLSQNSHSRGKDNKEGLISKIYCMLAS